MAETKNKDDAAADLALIGAAQRVQHYEIAAYMTARNLPLQLRQPAPVQLLTSSSAPAVTARELVVVGLHDSRAPMKPAGRKLSSHRATTRGDSVRAGPARPDATLPIELMRKWPISTRVNKLEIDDAIMEPVELGAAVMA